MGRLLSLLSDSLTFEVKSGAYLAPNSMDTVLNEARKNEANFVLPSARN
jgi:hypothetical protein